MKHHRVVVYSAKFGNGHIRAAEAIIETIREVKPQSEIFHFDFGEFVNKNFNFILKRTYINLIKYTPKLWGKFYYRTAKISPDSTMQRFLNNLGRERFLEHINELKPDIIITTYPTVAGVLGQLRKEKEIEVPLVTVVTDYVVHSQWIHHGVDMYIVGCSDVQKGLVKRGIDPGCIRVTGIPIDPKFEKSLNRQKIIKGLGLNPHLKTLLIMGGAYGVLNGIKDICHLVANSPIPLQAMVVCGKDKKLYNSLREIVNCSNNKVLRFGFVNNVEELMTAADFMVSKAGGLSVSEALTKHLPILVFKPIPGQEEINAYFLSKVGAGRRVTSLKQLKNVIQNLVMDPGELEKMQLAAAQAIPRHSAEQAVKNILSLVNNKNETKIG